MVNKSDRYEATIARLAEKNESLRKSLLNSTLAHQQAVAERNEAYRVRLDGNSDRSAEARDTYPDPSTFWQYGTRPAPREYPRDTPRVTAILGAISYDPHEMHGAMIMRMVREFSAQVDRLRADRARQNGAS